MFGEGTKDVIAAIRRVLKDNMGDEAADLPPPESPYHVNVEPVPALPPGGYYLEPLGVAQEAQEEPAAPALPPEPAGPPVPLPAPLRTYQRKDLRFCLSSTEVHIAVYDQPKFAEGLGEAFRCLCNIVLITDALYRHEKAGGQEEVIQELLQARRQEAIWLRMALTFVSHGRQQTAH